MTGRVTGRLIQMARNLFLTTLGIGWCDPIGLFFKVLGDNFSCNNSTNIFKLFGPFEKSQNMDII